MYINIYTSALPQVTWGLSKDLSQVALHDMEVKLQAEFKEEVEDLLHHQQALVNHFKVQQH